MKRRVKKDILLGLPQKNDKYLRLEMPKKQKERYRLELMDANGSETSKQGEVLRILFALREICDHPFLADLQIESVDTDLLVNTSAKLISTVSLLESIQGLGEKVLLFSENKRVQRMLAKVLRERFGLTNVSVINGETPASKATASLRRESRQVAITRFEAKPGFNAVVVSPLAAGVGLNITGANHVIHYTRHWNPAKENQATDRVYRIGQDKEVFVYYPLCVCEEFETFDVVLDKLLMNKRSLASATLYPIDQSEVDPHDLYSELLHHPDEEIVDTTTFDYDGVVKLDPYLFESACAVLFEKEGFTTVVTPRCNDKGADVICFGESENLLLQVKLTSSRVSDSVLGEVLKAVGFYKERYNRDFRVGIVTNADLTQSGRDLAYLNNIKVFDGKYLQTQLQMVTLTLSEIRQKERQRIAAF